MTPKRTNKKQVEDEFIGRMVRSGIRYAKTNPVAAVVLGIALGGATGTGALPAVQKALGFGTASDIQEIKELLQVHVHESQAVHRSIDSLQNIRDNRLAALEKQIFGQ